MKKSVLDHPLLSNRYFFPRKTHVDSPFWVDCGDVRLACYFHREKPDAKTFVLFHGSGEVVSDYQENFVPIIASMGYNCFLAEYRGYGMSDGEPALVKMLEDVAHIVTAIDQPPEELILFGRSLGSIYAIHGAYLFPQISGLIIESGIANPITRLLSRVSPNELNTSTEDIQAAIHADINHKRKLAKYKGPLLVMHTLEDGLLDVSHAEYLYKWASSPRKTMKIFQHGNHNSILFLNFHEYFQMIQQFMNDL